MDEMRECPECGVKNHKSRLTCTACHSRMVVKPGDDASKGKKDNKDVKSTKDTKDTKGGKEAKDTKTTADLTKAVTQTQTPPKTSPILPTKDPAPEPPQTAKRVIKRRKRRTAPIATDPTFFMLEDGKLMAVNVRLVISKPIKPISLSEGEKGIISFVNRNKAVLTG